LDGLIDYGDDFTDAGTVVANMQTAYQVGRGYKRDPEPEMLEEDDLDGLDQDQIASAEAEQDPESDDDDTVHDGEGGELVQQEGDHAGDQNAPIDIVHMDAEAPQKVAQG
jgi:hypothetical protein